MIYKDLMYDVRTYKDIFLFSVRVIERFFKCLYALHNSSYNYVQGTYIYRFFYTYYIISNITYCSLIEFPICITKLYYMNV